MVICKPGPDSPPSCIGSFFYLACTVLAFVVPPLWLQQDFLIWKSNSNKIYKIGCWQSYKRKHAGKLLFNGICSPPQVWCLHHTLLTTIQLSITQASIQRYVKFKQGSNDVFFLSKILTCHPILFQLMFHPGWIVWGSDCSSELWSVRKVKNHIGRRQHNFEQHFVLYLGHRKTHTGDD